MGLGQHSRVRGAKLFSPDEGAGVTGVRVDFGGVVGRSRATSGGLERAVDGGWVRGPLVGEGQCAEGAVDHKQGQRWPWVG